MQSIHSFFVVQLAQLGIKELHHEQILFPDESVSKIAPPQHAVQSLVFSEVQIERFLAFKKPLKEGFFIKLQHILLNV